MTEPRPPLVEAFGPWRLPVAGLGVLVALFLLLPLAIILPIAFTSDEFLTFPPPGLSTRWFEQLVEDESWRLAASTSARTAIPAALIATVFGTMAALALRRVDRGARWLRTAFLAPMVVPQIVLALGLYDMFDRTQLVESAWPIVIGQAALAFPIALVTVSAGLAAVPTALIRAGQSLGARWPVVAWRVELPLVRRSVLAAAIFSLAFCFDEAVVAYFLSTPDNVTVPTQIWLSARDAVSPSIAAASIVVISVAIVAGVAGWALLRERER